MGISLIFSTLISITSFGLVAIIFLQIVKIKDHVFRNFFTGGIAWSIVSAIVLLPSLLLYEQSSISAFIAVLDVDESNKRTLAFWVILFNVIIYEVIRWRSISDRRFFDRNYQSVLLYGLGWTTAEFITRFIFFFDNGEENKLLYLVILFSLMYASNTGLTTIQLRVEENTKFVMFAIFQKFFIELAIIASFGYEIGINNALTRLTVIIILQLMLVYISIITQPKANAIPLNG